MDQIQNSCEVGSGSGSSSLSGGTDAGLEQAAGNFSSS
jgi:hypothetical protein